MKVIVFFFLGIRKMVYLRCDQQRIRLRSGESPGRLHQSLKLHRLDRLGDRYQHSSAQRHRTRRERIERGVLRGLRSRREPAT